MRINVFILIFFTISINIFSSELQSVKYKDSEEAVNKLFHSVEKWLGTPYKVGGLNKSGVDCSGFTSAVYRDVFDINLPRTVTGQRDIGVPVTGNLKTGDLLFFNTTGKLSHVGIYLFDNKFVHAASQGPSIGVIKSSLDEKYYKNSYLYARRVVDLSTTKNTKSEIVIDKSKDEPKREEKKEAAKEVKIEIDAKDTNFELVLGKMFYRDNVVSENKFKNVKKIFFQINNFSKNIDGVVLEILYNNAHLNKYMIQFDSNRYISKIDVLEGSYSFRVLNDNNLLIEKKIIVE